MTEETIHRAYLLVTLVEKTLGHPKLKVMHDWAMGELVAMNDKLVQPEEKADAA